MDAPRCWAWSAIATALADGPVEVDAVAQEVYGDDTRSSRRAVSAMLRDLARPNFPYRGGPWVRQVRRGVYALATDHERAYTSPRSLLPILKRRPKTQADLVYMTGMSPRTIKSWLRELRLAGVQIQEGIAPPWRWAAGWCPWYWIGAAAMRQANPRRVA